MYTLSFKFCVSLLEQILDFGLGRKKKGEMTGLLPIETIMSIVMMYL